MLHRARADVSQIVRHGITQRALDARLIDAEAD
jgi:hypothetical protein